MKSIKSFDMFQKVSIQNIQEQTVLGGLISLITIGLVIFLIIKEIISYLSPSIKKEPIILNYFNHENQINANFSIKINCPCALISLDQESLMGSHVMDITDGIEKVRMNQAGQVEIGSYIPYKTDPLQKSFIEKESCYMNGFVKISKPPGDLHISFHKFREVWEFQKREGFNNSMILDHKILSFTFGDKKQNEEIRNIFGDNENTHMLISHQIDFPDYRNQKEIKKFDYYLKLIPHLFYDERSQKSFLSYQYSISHKSEEMDSDEEMPIIMINYDMSPITMKITLINKKFSNFLVHICAIIGGIFTVFGILNNFLLVKFR